MRRAEKIFRQHDVAPDVTSSALYRQLVQDWVWTQSRPTVAASLQRWGRTEPHFEGFSRPADVVDAIDAGNHQRKDTLLLALLRLTQAGEPLASQTVLHAMLPGLAGLAARTTPKLPTSEPDRAEATRQLVVEEFLEVAAEFPVLRRRQRVASNLLLDTVKRVTSHIRQAVPRPFDPTPLYTDVAPEQDRDVYRAVRAQADGGTPSLVDGIDPDADLLTVLTWAVSEGVVTTADAQMLADVYVPITPDGWGFDHVAESVGASRAAVKMRCSRAVAKLSAAARAGATQC
ncbi:hypothetical protein MWU57_08125 [Isoptericola sp. S6320L]|uniref:hypothetical protein n=1 Tax=Isoptericola sp. S6320L TaxID=2926411 RepID=UPI001FF20CBE|nr:hypothetical protein [Isoptericola sp. S6320L]MCK0117001.1 hypothetical protein [Isoptericola sp. S6320L]